MYYVLRNFCIYMFFFNNLLICMSSDEQGWLSEFCAMNDEEIHKILQSDFVENKNTVEIIDLLTVEQKVQDQSLNDQSSKNAIISLINNEYQKYVFGEAHVQYQEVRLLDCWLSCQTIERKREYWNNLSKFHKSVLIIVLCKNSKLNELLDSLSIVYVDNFVNSVLNMHQIRIALSKDQLSILQKTKNELQEDKKNIEKNLESVLLLINEKKK